MASSPIVSISRATRLWFTWCPCPLSQAVIRLMPQKGVRVHCSSISLISSRFSSLAPLGW